MKTNTNGYCGYRFPREIIGHSVWLYHRFCLSFRDVEELLAMRGIIVSSETISNGAGSSGRITHESSSVDRVGMATCGTWTRYS